MCPTLAFAQGANPGAPPGVANLYEHRLRCQAPNPPANPYKRKFGCKDVHFDAKETLSGDWSGARSILRDNYGVTPTASHVAAFQTNKGGHVPQEWNYDGQLSFSLDFNLRKILSVPGLSFYFSAFENSGGNLSGVNNSTFPVNTLYVGPFHGEMYMQESFEDGRLLFAAGRLGPNFQFATIPVLGNYVNGGFNAQVSNIGVNDPAFFGPPPGVEWGSQIVYHIDTTLELSSGVFNNNIPSAHGVNYGDPLYFAKRKQGGPDTGSNHVHAAAGAT